MFQPPRRTEIQRYWSEAQAVVTLDERDCIAGRRRK